MNARTDATTLRRRMQLAIAALLVAACGHQDNRASLPAGEWLEFGGSWTATGTRRTLELGPEHRASVFDLTGSLQLTGAQKPAVGFKAQALGLSESEAGMHGRALWTDERGDQVFSELKGEGVGTGNRITGTITGGTGRYTGVIGEYRFEWQYVVEGENGSVSGRAIGFEGRARLAPTAETSPR